MPSEFSAPSFQSLTLPRRRRGRLPVETRERALADMHRMLAEGLSQRQVAETLGLSPKTIQRWASPEEEAPLGSVGPGALQPVLVTPDAALAPAAGHPVLTTPSGHRVTGLSLEQLALLLRMLE
ncbi:MAG: helix-turn-helix domain-containing protein [Candidatus Sericytochromatia bacterium]|nr:helix-turn-helix domain-containing protein [Candidatus Tanganyikabacteria bacterium]